MTPSNEGNPLNTQTLAASAGIVFWSIPIFFLLVLASMLSWFAYDEYENTMEREFGYLESNVRIADAQVTATLERTERLLNKVAQEQAALQPAQQAAYDIRLAEYKTLYPEIRSLVVIGANGRVNLTAHPSLKNFDAANRDYFLAHLNAPLQPNFYVSRPFKTSHGDLGIAVSIALRDTKNRLTGVVVCGIDPDYFDRILRPLVPAGAGGNAALLNTQGDALNRQPPNENESGKSVLHAAPFKQHAQSGQRMSRQTGVAILDNLNRFFVFSQVGNTSLLVRVTRPVDAVLAKWRVNVLIRIVVFSFATILILALTHLARRREQERESALDRLQKIANNLPGMVYEFRRRADGSTHLPYASPAIEKIFRITPEQVFNNASPAFEAIHPDDLPAILASIERSAQTLTLWHAEFRLRFADGSTPWLLGNAMPQREPDGSTLWHGFIADISETQVQREYLNELLRINESILQNAMVGIVYLKHRTVVSANRRAEEIFGYARGEMIGVSTAAFYDSHDYYQSLGERAYKALEQPGTNYSEETLMRHKDGTIFWGALNGRAIDHTQPHEGSIWIYADISERHFAEQASRKLLKAVEQAPVAIVITTRDGTIEFINPAFTRNTGYSAREVIGGNPRILRSDVTTDATYQDLWKTVLAGNVWRGTLCNRRKDGRLIWEDTSISPISDDHGEITHFIAVKEDITERLTVDQRIRESEEAFRHLFEDVGDPLLLIRDGRFIDCNTATLKLLGYADKTTFLNRTPAELSPPTQPDDRASDEKAREMIDTAIRSGNVRFEWVHLCADGSPIPVEVTLTPVILRGETLIHTAWRDITERQRIQHQLMLHQTQLEHMVLMRTQQLTTALEDAKIADRAKDEFLANISHELRTPLSAVIGFSGLARPLATDPQLRDYLEKITYAGRSLSGIINDLLDISKISAGHMEMETITFRLSDLVARCQSLMAWKAEEKHLNLVESIDADVPDILMGDPLRLEQIILNLLSNAVKFTASGQVALRVSLVEYKQERICMRIEVEDSGIGMNAEQLQLLFKPFSQSDASISRRFGGTGLGLAICKRLCELMGGNIEVTSRQGIGTIFRVTLWCESGHAENLPKQDMQSGTDARSLHYQHARILVVDDQPFNREIVTGLLGAVGIATDTANNGSEAIELLLSRGSNTYDLVLMDIQMPVLDGLSATRALRARAEFAKLPIIAMTAHTMTHERTNSRKAGMNDHIGKPFDEAGFYTVIRKWIAPVKHLSAGTLKLAEPKAQPTSPTNLPPLSGVDTQSGLSLLLGNETRYRHWLMSFIDEGPAFLAQARQALAEGRPNDAGIAIHTLKGRAGMLGMKELQAMSAKLEGKVDAGDTADELFAQTEQAVSAMCDEIRSAFALGSSSSTAATAAVTPAQEAFSGAPQEPMPASIQRLLILLEAGDGDCESVLAACLEEHQGSAWVPCLQRAMIEIGNFRFAAARAVLSPQKD